MSQTSNDGIDYRQSVLYGLISMMCPQFRCTFHFIEFSIDFVHIVFCASHEFFESLRFRLMLRACSTVDSFTVAAVNRLH